MIRASLTAAPATSSWDSSEEEAGWSATEGNPCPDALVGPVLAVERDSDDLLYDDFRPSRRAKRPSRRKSCSQGRRRCASVGL